MNAMMSLATSNNDFNSRLDQLNENAMTSLANSTN
eukprot:CAMPEP_0182501142 /NCGR_PEP_ID=MMETSP1321-20130603/10742_1 /TAXON_ID=91990 /ORGANISM="Bolidomonas sp., Strain RCC1657" /LENGTH=34 /DNA_ID= /DNA_START= /DNA_END= /DNA_ORIENTATION=